MCVLQARVSTVTCMSVSEMPCRALTAFGQSTEAALVRTSAGGPATACMQWHRDCERGCECVTGQPQKSVSLCDTDPSPFALPPNCVTMLGSFLPICVYGRDESCSQIPTHIHIHAYANNPHCVHKIRSRTHPHIHTPVPMHP